MAQTYKVTCDIQLKESYNGSAGPNRKQELQSQPSLYSVELSNDSLAAESHTSGPHKRDEWSSGTEFLMSCIALSVGLGNVWRFPYAALDNGGGAFVIPYLVILFLIGKPIYYMEMIIAQMSSRGSVEVYDMVPMMRGIGVGQVFASGAITTYYAALLAMILRYLVASFQATLPWGECQLDWSTVQEVCVDSSQKLHVSNITYRSSADLFFFKVVLKEADSLDNGLGVPDWKLALCLVAAWTFISFILIKGIQSSGKMSYFLALFPYFMIGVLLIRAVTLPGSAKGILYLFTPQFDQLLNPKVWFSAVSQVFFSLSVCLGLIIMFSSFNRFDHNIYRDTWIVTSLDTVTSFMSGIIIFGILGNVAHETGTDDIRALAKSGAGLAFVTYPDAIAKFAWIPQIFSVVFFFMLFVLGLGSNVGLCVCLTNVLRDRFQRLSHAWAIVLVASAQLCIGLCYITPGGQFMLNLVDFFGVSMVVYVLAIFELGTIAWIYGVDRLCADVEFMLGRKTGCYWRICWGFITPVMMIVIFAHEIVTLEPLTYKGRPYPAGFNVLGWGLLLCGVLPLVIIAADTVIRAEGPTFKHKLAAALKPKESWGPKDRSMLLKYKAFIAEHEARTPTTFMSRLNRNLLGK